MLLGWRDREGGDEIREESVQQEDLDPCVGTRINTRGETKELVCKPTSTLFHCGFTSTGIVYVFQQ
jgi:hypothetical protein